LLKYYGKTCHQTGQLGTLPLADSRNQSQAMYLTNLDLDSDKLLIASLKI